MAADNPQIDALNAQIATWQAQIASANANKPQDQSNVNTNCAKNFWGKQNDPSGCTLNTADLVAANYVLANNPGLIANANAKIAQLSGGGTESSIIWWLGGALIVLVATYFLGRYNGWWGA